MMGSLCSSRYFFRLLAKNPFLLTSSHRRSVSDHQPKGGKARSLISRVFDPLTWRLELPVKQLGVDPSSELVARTKILKPALLMSQFSVLPSIVGCTLLACQVSGVLKWKIVTPDFLSDLNIVSGLFSLMCFSYTTAIIALLYTAPLYVYYVPSRDSYQLVLLNPFVPLLSRAIEVPTGTAVRGERVLYFPTIRRYMFMARDDFTKKMHFHKLLEKERSGVFKL